MSGEHILVIEDTPAIARTLRAALERDPRAAGTIPSTKGKL